MAKGAPDYTRPVEIRGVDSSGNLKTLRIDDVGRILAMLYALYNSTETPLKCDQHGNLMLNLKAQDLAYVVQRPMYGQAKIASGYKDIPASTTETLLTISGKGKTYGGIIYIDTDHTCELNHVVINVDSELLVDFALGNLNKWAISRPNDFLIWLTCYNDENYIYGVGIANDITFESSFEVKYQNTSASAVRVYYILSYALLTS